MYFVSVVGPAASGGVVVIVIVVIVVVAIAAVIAANYYNSHTRGARLYKLRPEVRRRD